ncbi:MAG: prolyl oligopeptidase family serine peptidase [bacterium]
MILSEEEIQLSDSQVKFIESGWGNEVVEDTIVKRIVYESDDLKVSGFLAHPKKIDKKYPIIIWNRGGNNEDGRIDDFLAKGIFGEIATWGYVVLASQYREADEFGGKDVNDVLNLIPISESISFCDSSRIGIEGWSRGGMMAYIVLSMTDRIKCAVIISGLSDLFRSGKTRSNLVRVYEKIFGSEDESEFIADKKKRSAVHFADKLNKEIKILLIHGTSDTKVSHLDSVDMYEKLQQNGIQCELKLIKNGDHYLKKQRKEIVKLRREWFDKFLNSATGGNP